MNKSLFSEKKATFSEKVRSIFPSSNNVIVASSIIMKSKYHLLGITALTKRLSLYKEMSVTNVLQ